jgi:hypothetical protein
LPIVVVVIAANLSSGGMGEVALPAFAHAALSVRSRAPVSE